MQEDFPQHGRNYTEQRGSLIRELSHEKMQEIPQFVAEQYRRRKNAELFSHGDVIELNNQTSWSVAIHPQWMFDNEERFEAALANVSAGIEALHPEAYLDFKTEKDEENREIKLMFALIPTIIASSAREYLRTISIQ